MTFRFLFYGIERVSITKKGIFWYYVPNLIFSFFISLFVTLKMEPFLTGSVEGEKFIESFNPSFFLYLEVLPQDFITTSKILLIAFSPLFLFSYLFLSGGAIKTLSRDWRSYDFKFFLSGCYNYFFKFLRLFILSVPFYLIPFLILRFYLIPYFEKIYAVDEVKLIFSKSLIYLFSFFLFAFINIVFDVTKLAIVTRNSKSVVTELFYTTIYSLRNFFQVISLYICTGLFNIIPLGLYIFISPFFLSSSSLFSILLSFLIFQLILLIRIWIKFVFWASQRELFLFLEVKRFN